MEYAALISCQLDQFAECRGSRKRARVAQHGTEVHSLRASHFRALPIEDAAHGYRVAGPFAELPAARKIKRLITNCCVDEMFSHKRRLGQRMPFGGEIATRVSADGVSGVDAKSPSMRGDCVERLVEFANVAGSSQEERGVRK